MNQERMDIITATIKKWDDEKLKEHYRKSRPLRRLYYAACFVPLTFAYLDLYRAGCATYSLLTGDMNADGAYLYNLGVCSDASFHLLFSSFACFLYSRASTIRMIEMRELERRGIEI